LDIGKSEGKNAHKKHHRSGWEYEILVPEEIEETEQVWVSGGKAGQGKASENLPLHSGQNLPPLTHTNPVENKGTYEFPKTSLKTIENRDDEAFGKMIEVFVKIAKKVTGSEPSKSDAAKWGELAELLAMELEVAAARTKSVSNAPAFLTEHLRRRFASTAPPSSASKNAGPSLKVGKTKAPAIEPLGDESREIVLSALQSFFDEGKTEFVESLQGTYTAEDWTWLMTNLRKN